MKEDDHKTMVRLSTLSTHIQVATKSEHPSEEFAPTRMNKKKFSKKNHKKKNEIGTCPPQSGKITPRTTRVPIQEKNEFRDVHPQRTGLAHLQRAGSASLAAQVLSFRQKNKVFKFKIGSPSSAGGVYGANHVGPYFQKKKIQKFQNRFVHFYRMGCPPLADRLAIFSRRGLRH